MVYNRKNLDAMRAVSHHANYFNKATTFSEFLNWKCKTVLSIMQRFAVSMKWSYKPIKSVKTVGCIYISAIYLFIYRSVYQYIYESIYI